MRLLIPEAFNYLYSANFKDMTKIQKEVWKDIIGFEGIYQISSIGRVKSCKSSKIIKHQFSKGYPSLKLCNNGVIKRFTIHRQMGLSFLKSTYFKGAQINHKNGIKTDNRVSNLEWVTASENCQHAHDSGLIESYSNYWSGKTGSDHITSKPILQLDPDGNIIAEYPSATFAAIAIGGNRQHISQCCTGTRKKSNGFIWRHKNDIHKI